MTSVAGWHFCLKCGGELPHDALYCALCGHPVSGDAPTPRFGGPSVLVGTTPLPLAPIGKRLGALLVDWLIVAAALYALFLVLIFVAIGVAANREPGDPPTELSARVFVAGMFVVWLAGMLVQWVLDSFGWSPGKAASSVRVMRLDGRRPGIVHGLVRYSTRLLSFAVFGLGYFWALWDARRQTWHDKLSGTVVVRSQPLQEQVPDRRPDPLVVDTRVWWLALFGAAVLTAGVVLSVWAVASMDADLFDPDPYAPYRLEDGQRIQLLNPADVLEGINLAPTKG